MTPIRIHVLYCVSITNTRIRPTSEVDCAGPLVVPGWTLLTGTGWAPARVEAWVAERLAASTASATPSDLEVARTNCAVVEVSVDWIGLFTVS